MSLCINPNCQNPQNPHNLLFCQYCGSELLLKGEYRVMRQLGEGGFGKTFDVSHNNILKVLYKLGFFSACRLCYAVLTQQ